GPHLLVLDWLERVQRQGDVDSTSYGQIEDPLLKGLLTRIAEGNSRAAVLATSRFPLIDLHLFREHGYSHVDIGGLDHPAAITLLRSRGVFGADDALASSVGSCGAQALTPDHL